MAAESQQPESIPETDPETHQHQEPAEYAAAWADRVADIALQVQAEIMAGRKAIALPLPELPTGHYELNSFVIGPGKATMDVKNPIRILGAFPQVQTRSSPLLGGRGDQAKAVSIIEIHWLLLVAEPAQGA